MVSGSIAGTFTSYTYDTLGNLTLETVKNKSVDYIYNELNQLVRKTTSTNDVYTYSYDGRGNRVSETGPKASQEFVFDATNRMVSGTNWKGDESAYTYNGLGIRVNNTHTTHAGQVYERDYVIDYTSFENDDLYVYAMGNGQLEYEQLHVYAGSERIEQFTERGNGNWERTLYVHEDVMGNTRYYTKTNGQSFAELEYDAWGMPASPNKLLNNDHGNYVFATFTGHIYDTTLDIYFAEARFYDANNRQWLSMDPVKDGLNWYLYCGANPTTYWDPTGLVASKFNQLKGSGSGFLGSVWDFLTGSAALEAMQEAKHAQAQNQAFLYILYGDVAKYLYSKGFPFLDKILGETLSESRARVNYNRNIMVDWRNIESTIPLVGENVYINTQRRDAIGAYVLGRKGDFKDNGCPVIAIYNSNIDLGIYESIADIIYEIETNPAGLLSFGGARGTTSNTIQEYYTDKGYTVDVSYIPSQIEIEESARKNEATIIYHNNGATPFSGGHFIYIDYNSEIQQYEIYNRFSNLNSLTTRDDLSELYGRFYHVPLILYSINGEDTD